MALIRSIWLAAIALSLCTAAPASAADLGSVKAAGACPAYQSIAKKTNPGDVVLAVGQTYAVAAHNREPPTYLQVVVETASPKARWVEVSCVTGGAAPAPTMPAKPAQPKPAPSAGGASDLLALAWEPSFCAAMPDKAECKAEARQSPEAHQLSLHGLWPQPKKTYFCISDPTLKAQATKNDTPANWGKMPDPHLSPAVLTRLGAVMPGVKSKLQFHEWNKHGTCFGGTADAYFSLAVALVDQINHSAAGTFFADNAGKTVKTSDIVTAFVKTYGPTAADAVSVSCTGKNISEIDVYLGPGTSSGAAIGSILHKADQASTCASGMLPLPPT